MNTKFIKPKHPLVKSVSTEDCEKNVDRLNKGPANIPEVIEAGDAYTDTDWEEWESVCNDPE